MSHGVLKTAKDALICKVSSKGISGSGQQSPLLDQFYKIRAEVIDFILQSTLDEILKYSNDSTENIFLQFIILGAGLDDSYYEKIKVYLNKLDGLYSQSITITIYEIDLPDIIKQRKSFKEIYLGVSGSIFHCFIECDLRNIDRLVELLYQNQFHSQVPTMFLAECVLSYISTEFVSKLIRTLSAEAPISHFISFDPILSLSKSDGFSNMMIEKFAQREAPLLHRLESVSAWKDFYYHSSSRSWKYVSSHSLAEFTCYLSNIKNDMLSNFSSLSSSSPVSLRAFDEFASLALLLRHYVVVIASSVSSLWRQTISTISDSSLFIPSEWKSMPSVNNTTSSNLLLQLNEAIRLSELRLSRIESILHMTSDIITTNGPCIHEATTTRWEYREVKSSDTLQIIHLYEQCFQDVCNKYSSVKKYVKHASTQLQKNLQSEVEDGKSMIAVTDSGAIIGHARWIHKSIFKRSGEISYVCVDEKYRRNGIARRLIKEILTDAKDIDYIDLTVIEGHHAAISTIFRNMYKNLQFKVVKETILPDTCRLYHMRKQLI